MGYQDIAIFWFISYISPSSFLKEYCFHLVHQPFSWSWLSLHQVVSFFSPVIGLSLSAWGSCGQGDVRSVVGASGKCFLVKKRQIQEWKIFFWMLCLGVLLHWGEHPLGTMKEVNQRAKSRLKTVQQEDGENPYPWWCHWAAAFAHLPLDFLCCVIYVFSVGIWRCDCLLHPTWKKERDVTHPGLSWLWMSLLRMDNYCQCQPAIFCLKPFISLRPDEASQLGASPF